MARELKFLLFFLLHLILCSYTEAASLSNILKACVHPKKESLEFFDGLSLGAIKESIPCPATGKEFTNAQTPGVNKFTNGKTFGRINISVPSPPDSGNRFTNTKILGGIKSSGPSPGDGRKMFTNRKTLGGIKISGPSSPGSGNNFINTKTVGEIMSSSPLDLGNNCTIQRQLEGF